MGAHHVSGPCLADLPTRRPTRLDQDNSTAWPGYLPASHLLMRLTYWIRSQSHHHNPPEGGQQWLERLVSPACHGRDSVGTGISTRCPSTTPVGLALGPDSPWEDELDPGTLSHPAVRILTLLSLLMPAFSLAHSPPPLTVWLHPMHDAPLPNITRILPRLRRCT